MLKSIARRVCHAVGYDVTRVRKPLFAVPQTSQDCDKKALIVEVLGPSGVGKSTLVSELAKTKKERSWTTTREWFAVTEGEGVKQELSEPRLILMNMRFEGVRRQLCHVEDKVNLLAFFLGNLKEDQRLSGYGKSECVVRDDGLFHNFGYELLELCQEDPKTFAEYVERRAFIVAQASDEVVLERLRSRDLERATRPQHKNTTDTARAEDLREVNMHYERLVAAIAQYGGRIKYLNMNETIAQRCVIISTWLREWGAQWDSTSGRWTSGAQLRSQ